jgi:high frequency lysogenization protein
MSRTDQTLGLAAMFRAVALGLELARTGRCDEGLFEASLSSIFTIDAEDSDAALGGRASLRHGLRLLAQHLDSQEIDQHLLGVIGSINTLARKLRRQPARQQRVRDGIEAARRSVDNYGVVSDGAVARLAEIYIDCVSSMSPRVMVPGDARYLSQERIAERVRALLLAAIRAAVLWQQHGGNTFVLLWRRRALAETARSLAAEA